LSFNGDLNESDEGTDLTTKGDLHGYSTENVRVPVGSDSYILSANSSEGTGLEWIANTDAGLTLGAKGDIHTRSSSAQAALAVGANGKILTAASGETTGLEWIDNTQSIIVAASDETTALTTGTAKVTWRMPYAFTLTAIRASLTTAGSTSGVTTIDVNEGGSSILSTLITIDQGELSSVTAATAPVISDSTLADDASMTVDIDGLSGGATEAGLKVTLIGYKTP
jgi:hypothetical protein